MAVSHHLPAIYDDFFSFVIEKATPQEILAFTLSDAAQERAIELLDRQDAGELTPEESEELEQMRQLDRLISTLKARALEAMSRK